jgi:NAD(P)-dependent dehydrogenase (short-subunit alcohol dehydrogenase family)
MKQMKDKVAVVTGGATGIGRAIGMALADKGSHVAVADLDGAAADRTAQEIAAQGVRAEAFVCDVADESSVEALADATWSAFGHVDMIFNNAGVTGGTTLLDSTAADMRWLFSVNVYGVWYGCSIFGRRFVEQGTPAWICNTGSEHSLGRPHLQAGFYNATKHAVLGLSDVLRGELPEHVGVSLLCPGIVASDFWQSSRRRHEEFGGAVEPEPLLEGLMAKGIDAADVGRVCVDGVERGDFFIVTHSHARGYADARYEEICAAFEAQAPRTEGDEKYDVTTLALRVLSDLEDESRN